MDENKKHQSALSVSEGITQPDAVRKDAVKQLKKAKKDVGHPRLLEGIREGDTTALSRSITLVESAHPDHQKESRELVSACLPHAGKAFRLGITGVPGAGKSTFIEALGKHIIEGGGKLAVLAIDPSSDRSMGSILGDKTRMEELAGSTSAFIRPSPSGGTLGGVARKTRETMILCEAAGFDHIFVETVGVGQSETTVHGMVDFFLLIMLAGAGDELQGIKRGIMEMADGIVINKADGSNLQKVRKTQAELTNALHLLPPSKSGWVPKVMTCSSLYEKGIDDVWKMISSYRNFASRKNYLNIRRQEQARFWMYETIKEGIYNHAFNLPGIRNDLLRLEKALSEGLITPHEAATIILDKYIEVRGTE